MDSIITPILNKNNPNLRNGFTYVSNDKIPQEVHKIIQNFMVGNMSKKLRQVSNVKYTIKLGRLTKREFKYEDDEFRSFRYFCYIDDIKIEIDNDFYNNAHVNQLFAIVFINDKPFHLVNIDDIVSKEYNDKFGYNNKLNDMQKLAALRIEQTKKLNTVSFDEISQEQQGLVQSLLCGKLEAHTKRLKISIIITFISLIISIIGMIAQIDTIATLGFCVMFFSIIAAIVFAAFVKNTKNDMNKDSYTYIIGKIQNIIDGATDELEPTLFIDVNNQRIKINTTYRNDLTVGMNCMLAINKCALCVYVFNLK